MRENGSILSIILERIYLDKTDAVAFSDLASGYYAKLSIKDTGHGISSELIHRIFDPYFTTKPVGEGTGMGLAVVHGIVKQHRGEITVKSEVRKGTAFELFFPIVEKTSIAETDRAESLPGGNETILFIDDEPAITGIYHIMLERLGYQVSVRTSSIEALEAFKAKPDKYDLIITDQTILHITIEMMAIRPNIPIILRTGNSDLINGEKKKIMGIKPLSLNPS